MTKNIGNTCGRIQIWCYLDDRPRRTHKLALKKWCLIVSSWIQNQHFLLPGQLHHARLSLISTTPLRRYHINILTFSGIFAFQIFLLLPTCTSECMSVRYIESTVKDPDVVRFQRNTSRPCVRLIRSRRDKRLCHDISRAPTKSRLNELFDGDELSK